MATRYTGLQERLFHSAYQGHVLDGDAHMFAQTAWVRVAGGGSLASDLRLGGWLRGALGHALKPSASAKALAGARCDWQWPCALDVLFGHQGHTRGNRPIAKPYVPLWRASDDGQDLWCGVRLFGFACEKIELVSDALVRGVAAPGTLRLHPRQLDADGRGVVQDVMIADDSLADVGAADGALVIRCQTPVSVTDHMDLATGRDLVKAMLARIGPLLRWCDFDGYDGLKALLTMGEQLRLDVERDGRRQWERRSHRQGGRTIAVEGQMLSWRIAQPPAQLCRLVALAQLCAMGDRCTLGLGQIAVNDA